MHLFLRLRKKYKMEILKLRTQIAISQYKLSSKKKFNVQHHAIATKRGSLFFLVKNKIKNASLLAIKKKVQNGNIEITNPDRNFPI